MPDELAMWARGETPPNIPVMCTDTDPHRPHGVPAGRWCPGVPKPDEGASDA